MKVRKVKIYKCFFPSFVIIIILIFILVSMGLASEKEYETKCYDKFGNEIFNHICLEEKYVNPWIEELVNFLPIIVLLFFVSMSIGAYLYMRYDDE